MIGHEVLYLGTALDVDLRALGVHRADDEAHALGRRTDGHMRRRRADIQHGTVEEAEIAVGVDSRAVHIQLHVHLFIDEQVAAGDTVVEIGAVNVGGQVGSQLDIGVSIDLVAAAAQRQLAVAVNDDRRRIGIVLAGEEGVDHHAGAVVFGIIVSIGDLAVAEEVEIVLLRCAVSALQEQAHGRAECPVIGSDRVVNPDIAEGDVHAVGGKLHQAAAQRGLGKIQLLTGLHRVIAHIEHRFVILPVLYAQACRIRGNGLAVLVRDDAAIEHVRIVLRRGGDDQCVRVSGYAVQGEFTAAIRGDPLPGLHVAGVGDLHMEGSSVRIIYCHVLRLERNTRSVGRISTARQHSKRQHSRKHNAEQRAKCPCLCFPVHKLLLFVLAGCYPAKGKSCARQTSPLCHDLFFLLRRLPDKQPLRLCQRRHSFQQ